jgi:hypothetical protein
MDPPKLQDTSIRAIRRLTFAVWALVLVLVVNMSLQLITGFLPVMFARNLFDDSHNPISLRSHRSVDPMADFYEWPLEKQVANASVIALTKFEQDGPRIKSVISEILKLAPGTTFNYHVGDEYARGSRYVRDNTSYGDGEIIFFTDSPATMRYSSTYQGGRLLGLGDLPIDVLRQKITQSGASESK